MCIASMKCDFGHAAIQEAFPTVDISMRVLNRAPLPFIKFGHYGNHLDAASPFCSSSRADFLRPRPNPTTTKRLFNNKQTDQLRSKSIFIKTQIHRDDLNRVSLERALLSRVQIAIKWYDWLWFSWHSRKQVILAGRKPNRSGYLNRFPFSEGIPRIARRISTSPCPRPKHSKHLVLSPMCRNRKNLICHSIRHGRRHSYRTVQCNQLWRS